MRPDDIVLITGKKRSGKSHFLKNGILPMFIKAKRRVLVWDYNWEHTNGIITHDLSQILSLFKNKAQIVVYQPLAKTPEAFDSFCSVALLVGNVLVVFEEVEHFACGQIVYTQPNLKIMLDSGRHLGIGTVFTTRRIMFLSSDIPWNSDHFYIFVQKRRKDCEKISEYVETDADELRQMLLDLPEHGFLWFDDKNGTLKTMPPLKSKSPVKVDKP